MIVSWLWVEIVCFSSILRCHIYSCTVNSRGLCPPHVFPGVTIATRALRSLATWSSTCGHTQGRSRTSASSAGEASSPPGSSSPTRRHTQVIVRLALQTVVLSMAREACSHRHCPVLGHSSHPKDAVPVSGHSPSPLGAPAPGNHWCLYLYGRACSGFHRNEITTRGLCHWLLSLGAVQGSAMRSPGSELHSFYSPTVFHCGVAHVLFIHPSISWAFELLPFFGS